MKYLSLFSGIGGFEYGLEQSKYDFDCIGASETDKYAKSIYFRHFPRHKDLGDATEIDPKELEDFDLLVGGFPCQAFSLSGKRKGFDDTRGTLFFEIARILKEKRPKYFLLENVKGLLSHDGGRTYKKMLGVLSELRYDVEWQIYNSKSHGVAQNRERLYIKGYFRAKCGREILLKRRNRTEASDSRKIKPVDNTELKPVEFGRQVRKRVHSTDYGELCDFLRRHKKAAKVTLVEISEKLGVPKSEVDHWFRKDSYFAPPTPEVWDELKSILNIKDDKYDAFITEFEYMDGVYEKDKRAYDTDGLGATLTCNGESLVVENDTDIKVVGNTSATNHGGENVYDVEGICSSTKARGRSQKGQTGALSTGSDWGTVTRDFRIRRLTPIECERLQAFPDNWTRYGKDDEEISDTQRYKCLGNAVTTTVITYIMDNEFFGEEDVGDDC